MESRAEVRMRRPSGYFVAESVWVKEAGNGDQRRSAEWQKPDLKTITKKAHTGSEERRLPPAAASGGYQSGLLSWFPAVVLGKFVAVFLLCVVGMWLV